MRNSFILKKNMLEIQKEALVGLLLSLTLALFFSFISKPADAAEKIIIGAVEDVILIPWGVKVPALMDTGAAESSLDVCDFTIEGRFVNFTLGDRCGGSKARLPLIGRRYVKTSEGSERRPVVEIEICIGSKRLRTPVTLNDRSRMEYSFLVGRKTLKGNFIVDVSLSKTVQPNCPDTRSP